MKGGLRLEKTFTYPIVFSLGVDPVIHSLNDTVPVMGDKKKKKTLVFRQAWLLDVPDSDADFMIISNL